MAYEDGNWYQHLVDQSRTDHIYDLIHGYLRSYWKPGHLMDFVVLQKDHLPAEKFPKGIPSSHIATSLPIEKYCFPDENYILLDNKHLTDYLDAAKSMRTVEDKEGRQFIELVFERLKELKYVKFNNEPDVDIETITPETLLKQEDALYVAYELLQEHIDKKKALEYARIAENYLNNKKIYVGKKPQTGLWDIEHKMLGYNIVAMVYAWNDLIPEASAIDSQYLFHPNVWDILEEVINPYLEMLMALDQTEYVQDIFCDMAFRKRFLTHYEAFVSLFIDNTYELTKQYEVAGIINKVNQLKRIYGKTS